MSCRIFSLQKTKNRYFANPYYLFTYADEKKRDVARKYIAKHTSLTLGIPIPESGGVFDVIFLKTMHELSLFNERVPSFQRLSIDSVIERATSYPYYDQPSDEDWKSMMSDFQTNPSKPLILLAGTGHHAAAVVFVKNYIFIVDTDNLADVNKPTCITIYELGTELTSDHLKTIANIHNRDHGLRESDMIKELQLKPIGSIQKKHQKMGTCTKSASFGICLTLFVVEHILRRDEGFIFNQAQIDQALKDAYRAYKKFSSQQRLLAI